MRTGQFSEAQLKTARLGPQSILDSQSEQQDLMQEQRSGLNAKFRLTNNQQRLRIKTQPTGSNWEMEFQKRQDKNINKFSQEYLALVKKLKVNLSSQHFEGKKSRTFVKERAHFLHNQEPRKFSSRQPSPQNYQNYYFYSKDGLDKKKSAFSLDNKEDLSLIENNLGRQIEQNKKNVPGVHYSQQKIVYLGQNLTKIRQKNESSQTLARHHKKMSILKQQRKKLLLQKHIHKAKFQEKQNLPEEDSTINSNYSKLEELCFHMEIVLDIYECIAQKQANERQLMKKIKNYVLGNKKVIEEEDFRVISDDVSHLQSIFCKDQLKAQLRNMVFMQRVLMVLILDLITNSNFAKYINEIKQILESVLGIYLYFIYTIKQSKNHMTPFCEYYLVLLQKRVKKQNIHFKKQISSLNIFINKKLFLIMKVSTTLTGQIKILMAELETRNVSINRAFYELLKLYAIYLNNNELLIQKNYKEIKSFATCPSPYLTKPNNKLYTLVLDLDQTLLHAHNEEDKLDIYLRPFAKQFLNTLAQHYEIIIFTSSLPSYAEEIIQTLPAIDHSLFRYHTTRVKHKHIKDLSRLGRPLEKMVIIDNEEQNFAMQKQNGIKVSDWRGDDPSDQQLNIIGLFLVRLAQQKPADVRDYLQGYKQFRKQYI